MSRAPITTLRNKDVLSAAFHEKSILIAGVSGGSTLMDKVGRQGPAEMILVDPGYVKFDTLSRMAFSFEDAYQERSKVDAGRSLIESSFAPGQGPRVTIYQDKVEALSESVFQNCDLIVAGTDSLEAQGYLSDLAKRLGIPFVAIGLHAGGKGGHIVYFHPEDNQGCYRCTLPERFEDKENADLAGEPAIITDILSVDMMAMRIILGLLERGQDSAMGRFYQAIAPKGYVVIGNHPDYEYGNSLVSALLADLPQSPKPFAKELKQYAFLSGYTVWLESAPSPRCPICRPAE